MKRIHYLLLGLLVSLTIAATGPGLPPTRIAPGANTTVVTNGINSFTISSSAGGAGAQLDGTNVFTGTNTFTAWTSITTNTIFHLQQRLLYYTNFSQFQFYPYTNAGVSSASNAPSNYYFPVTDASILAVSRPSMIGIQLGYRRKATSGVTEIAFANLWSGTNMLYSPFASANGGSRGAMFLATSGGSSLFYTRDGTNLFYNQPNASATLFVAGGAGGTTNAVPVPLVNVSAPWLLSMGWGYNSATVTEDSPITLEYLAVWEIPLFYAP